MSNRIYLEDCIAGDIPGEPGFPVRGRRAVRLNLGEEFRGRSLRPDPAEFYRTRKQGKRRAD